MLSLDPSGIAFHCEQAGLRHKLFNVKLLKCLELFVDKSQLFGFSLFLLSQSCNFMPVLSDARPQLSPFTVCSSLLDTKEPAFSVCNSHSIPAALLKACREHDCGCTISLGGQTRIAASEFDQLCHDYAKIGAGLCVI